MSSALPLFWCLGGVLVDHIGRANAPVQPRQSNPGAARLRAGGVALNIARALADHGARVAVISAVGDDIGADLITDWQDGIDLLDFTAVGLGFADFTAFSLGGGTLLELTSDPTQEVWLSDAAFGSINGLDFV